MESEKIKELSDDELVETSGSTAIGTTSGQKAQHAQAELIRRLMETIRDANETTTKYSKVMLAFTFVLFVISLLQLVTTIFTLNFNTPIRVLMVGISFFILVWVFWRIDKEWF